MTSSRFSLKALKSSTNSSSTPTISTTSNGNNNSRNNSASTPILSDQHSIGHHLDIASDRNTTNTNNRNSMHSHQSYSYHSNGSTTIGSTTTPRTPGTIGSNNHTITIDASYVDSSNTTSQPQQQQQNSTNQDNDNWTPISRNNSKKSLSSSFRKLLFGCRNVRGQEEEEQEKMMINRSKKYLPDDELFNETSDHLVDDGHNHSHVMALVSPRGKSSPRNNSSLSPARQDAEMKRRSVESPTMMLMAAASSSPSSSNNNHSMGGASSYSLRNKIFAGAIPEDKVEEVIMNSDYPQKVHLHFEGQYEVRQCHHLDTISEILPAFKDCITPFVKIEWKVEFFNTLNNLKKKVPIVKPTQQSDINTWKLSKKTTVACLEVGRKDVSWNEVLDFSITVEGHVHKNVLELYKKNSDSTALDQLTKPYGEHIIGILSVKSYLYDYDDLLLQENIISYHTMEFPITLKSLMKHPTTATSPSLKIESYIENFGSTNSPIGSVPTNSHVKLQSVGASKGTNSPLSQEVVPGFSEQSIVIYEKNQPVQDCQMVQDGDSEIVLQIVPVVELSYYVKMVGSSVCV